MNKKILIAATVAATVGILKIPAVKKLKNKLTDEVIVPLSVNGILKKKKAADNKK